MKFCSRYNLILTMLSGVGLISAVCAWSYSRPYEHDAIQLKPAPQPTLNLSGLNQAPAPKFSPVPELPLPISAEMRLMFDYAIQHAGAQADDVVRRYLERDFSARRLARAIDLYQRYANYQQAWQSAEQKNQTELATLSAYQNASLRLSAMHELRARYFSAREELALFAIDDAYDKQQLQRLLLGDGANSEVAEVKTLLVADQQIRNYQGYYQQHMLDQ